MTIDTSRNKKFDYKIIIDWVYDSHSVAWVQLKQKNGDDEWSKPYLICECNFNYIEEKDENGHTFRRYVNDPSKCQAKEAIRKKIQKEARELYGEHWRSVGVEDAILDIYQRVRSGEFLGQCCDEIVYVQEVAELLEIDERYVWSACGSLFAKDKLNLSGAVLCEFVSRFRFPVEMQSVLRYIVEEPLGWPNGDAGDGFVCGVESNIHRTTRFKCGRDAFGEDNYPNIDLKILADYAFDWIDAKLCQASADTQALEALYKLEKTEIVSALTGLGLKYPKISVEIFAEFVYECIRASLDRIEVYKEMQCKLSAQEILKEIASYFNQLAKRCRGVP